MTTKPQQWGDNSLSDEVEQLRKENQRLQQDLDAAIRQLADEGRTRGAVELERDRLKDENQLLRTELEAANKWQEALQEATALNWVLTAEVEQLRAIVAKLPKTADGVPVVPGMTVWKMHRDVVHGIEVKDWGRCRGVCSLRIGMATYNLTPDETYSTRDAAIAASKKDAQA